MKRTAFKPRKKPLTQGKGQLKRSGKLRPFSKRKAERYAEYRKYRDAYMLQNPICEVEGCRRPSTDPHHLFGRRGKDLLRGLMAVCAECHRDKIHGDVANAKKMGWLHDLNR